MRLQRSTVKASHQGVPCAESPRDLVHTPESPQELRGGAIAGAKRRYANYQAAVAERVSEADRANTRPKDAQGDLED